jgi:hypothetical protein
VKQGFEEKTAKICDEMVGERIGTRDFFLSREPDHNAGAVFEETHFSSSPSTTTLCYSYFPMINGYSRRLPWWDIAHASPVCAR